MSPYLTGGIIVVLAISWIGCVEVGRLWKGDACTAADGQHDLAQAAINAKAQQHVATENQQYSKINQGADDVYAKSLSFITAIPPVSLPIAPIVSGSSMSSIPKPATGISPVYHLTYRQCDIEEAKLTALFNRDIELARVK